MSYTNKTTLENYLGVSIPASLNTFISNSITAVENYINKYTGKKDGFENSIGSLRYFDGNGKRKIDIDEFTSITSLVIYELDDSDTAYTLTEGIDSDYVAYPYNDTPKYRLKLTLNAQVANWPVGKRRIGVTAIWGNSTSVPKDIELVATMLLSTVYETNLKGGKVKSESLGDYSVTYEDIDKAADSVGRISVKNILNQYKIFEL